MRIALEPPHVLDADAPMPRRRLVGCIGVAWLLAALALVAETPVRTLSARQAGAPQYYIPKSPLNLQVIGMPAAIRLGDEFSFTLTVRNDGASVVNVPTSTSLALRRQGLTPNLRAVVSLFPGDGRKRPLVFAFSSLAGSHSGHGSMRALGPNETVDLEITAKLGLRSEEEKRDLVPLLPGNFAARARLAFRRPTDGGVWYAPSESTPFLIRIEPPVESADAGGHEN